MCPCITLKWCLYEPTIPNFGGEWRPNYFGKCKPCQELPHWPGRCLNCKPKED